MKLSNIFIATIILFSIAFTTNIEASLSVHTEEIRDTIISGENKTIVLHITNSSGVLNYQLSSDVDWIEFSSISGDINAGDTVAVNVTFNTYLLYSGINTANIYVGDPHHGPITIHVELFVQGGITGVQENLLENIPTSFSLKQNYPNPFNPSTKIDYTIPETQRVVVKVFNVLGSEIMTLVDAVKTKGSYTLELDMNGFASGVYFYMLKTHAFVETKKMILSK